MSRLTTEIHPLLTETVLEKLINKNIGSIYEFLEADIKNITTITDLTYKNILIIRKHIINKNAATTKSAFDYYKEYVNKTAIISTGISSIDKLIGGGLFTGNIYEICGLPNTGKTQFCFTLLIRNARDLEHKVYYINTKQDFCVQRLKQIINTNDEETIHTILEKILVKDVHSCYELINSLYEIKRELFKNLKLRLIIIDSLAALFYQNNHTVKDKSVMNSIINIMKFIAKECHVVFVITNLVTQWWEGAFTENEISTEKIGCGNLWLSVPNTRFKITCTLEDLYEVQILKSTSLQEGLKCYVKLNDLGMFS